MYTLLPPIIYSIFSVHSFNRLFNGGNHSTAQVYTHLPALVLVKVFILGSLRKSDHVHHISIVAIDTDRPFYFSPQGSLKFNIDFLG